MAILNTIISFFGATDVAVPGKLWHWLILNVFDFVVDYGWRIIVFTVLLKLVLSPLDFYQRYKMHKNQKITERLKPTMEKIQKQYGNDKQAFSQKQMELNRKEGYSYFSSCLPMIITMVVFITLWLSMNTVARYMTLKEYTTLYDEYNIVYEQTVDTKGDDTAREIAQDVVFKYYYDGITDEYVSELKTKYGLDDSFKLDTAGKLQASFLWVKNIWAPDVPWGDQAILSWSAFETAIDDYKTAEKNGMSSDQIGACLNEATYTRVMGKLLSDSSHSRVNGYLILPVLVVLLSVASQLVSSLQQKKAGQVNATGGMATSMKVMMFIMPLMMAVFAIRFASIFTVYMVTNSACTLLFNFLFSVLIKAIDDRRQSRHYGISVGSPRRKDYSDSPIIHYVKGANPDAGKREQPAPAAAGGGKLKKGKSNGPTVVRSGRPDPNELMNYDMSSKNKNKK